MRQEKNNSKKTEDKSFVKKSKIGSPQSIVLRSQASKNDFFYLEKHFSAAWYTSSMIGDTFKEPSLGVIVQKDIVYQSGEMTFVLRRGGVLIQRPDKLIQAFQQDFFESKFFRCFGDGTKICGANEEKMTQAVLLSESNSQLRKKLEQDQTITSWRKFLCFWSINKRTKKMRRWNEEIQAHISDLTLRHKMSLR